jgi:hypothetical protein
MRLFGILLVVAGLTPTVLTVYAMVKGFNNHIAVDEEAIHRALILTSYGIPVLALGIAIQIVAAIRKRRTGRIGDKP